MDAVILAAKSGLALMLVVAGSAKLAGVSGFAASVKLFLPIQGSFRVMERIAIGVAIFELALAPRALRSHQLRSSTCWFWLRHVRF